MRSWFALLAVLVVPIALGAVESECPTTYSSGQWEVRECFLCDGDHTVTDCAEFDLQTEGGALPEFVVADLAATTGCAGAVSVDVRGLSQQLGVPHVYGSLTVAGVSSLRINPIRHRHLDADVDITSSADCTDLEVLLRLYYPRVLQ